MFDNCFLVSLYGFGGGSVEGIVVDDLLFKAPAGELEILVVADGVLNTAVLAACHGNFHYAAEVLSASCKAIAGKFLADVNAKGFFLRLEEAVEHVNGKDEAGVSRRDIREDFALGDLQPREDLQTDEAEKLDVFLYAVLEVVGEVEVELFAGAVNEIRAEASLIQVVLPVSLVSKALDLSFVERGLLQNRHAVEEGEACGVVGSVYDAGESLHGKVVVDQFLFVEVNVHLAREAGGAVVCVISRCRHIEPPF